MSSNLDLLPTELLLLIYQSCKKFSDVLNLTRTSKRLHDIFLEHSTVIFPAVLVNQMSFYSSEVMNLFSFQYELAQLQGSAPRDDPISLLEIIVDNCSGAEVMWEHLRGGSPHEKAKQTSQLECTQPYLRRMQIYDVDSLEIQLAFFAVKAFVACCKADTGGASSSWIEKSYQWVMSDIEPGIDEYLAKVKDELIHCDHVDRSLRAALGIEGQDERLCQKWRLADLELEQEWGVGEEFFGFWRM
ncbi:MAG: hypothetical protein M1821_000536 [Bathelium mastoideum]|nr:MAG: hypothetical protein M1821_000536 [Bathelium mastoideum]